MTRYILKKDFFGRDIVDIVNNKFNIKQDFEYILSNSDIKCLSHNNNIISYEGNFRYIDNDYQLQSCYYLMIEDTTTNEMSIIPVIF